MTTSLPGAEAPLHTGTPSCRALIVPPAAWGSLGDVAMMNGALSTLKASGFERVDVTLAPPEDFASAPSFDGFVDGQGWFYRGDTEGAARLRLSLENYSHVFLIGADCIDGSYNPNSIIRRIALVGEAIDRGCRGRILGASFKDNANARCLEALRQFPASGEILARDPVSRRRMEASIGRTIVQSADLAFLCPADPDHRIAKPLLEWIATQRSLGRKVVALNINANIAQIDPAFARAHRQMLKTFLRNDVSVILAPNDVRSKKNDQYFLRLAGSDLYKAKARRFRWLPALHPSATKAVLGAVDLLISSRMHAAILAAGAGRPAFCFVYQGKFEGLYDLLGLDGQSLLFSPDELVASPSRMTRRVMQTLSRAEELAATLNAALPRVHELALRNFAGLAG